MKNLWPLAVIVGGLIAVWLAGCQSTAGSASNALSAIPVEVLRDFSQNCDVDLSFGGVAIAGNIKCSPHPVQTLAPAPKP